MEFKSFVFYGESYQEEEPLLSTPHVPDGTYMVVDGELRPLVDGSPPGAIPFTEESGLFKLCKEGR